MSTEHENSLGRAASAYLRSARHQPIDWHEWGAEAFAKAERENKPVLLDIGAVWCHWCHVMDRESYENAATAGVINEHFIAVKVDRDERPDVDTRYQAAVSTISGQGGWPLTAFLTPEGKPYFGGTYFPPEDRYGRPSFQRVLLTMVDAFHNQRADVNESADGVMLAIEENESFSGRAGNPGSPLLEKLIDSAIQQFDERNGGFGSQPKFPHSAALDLLIDAASRGGDLADRARNVVTVTLQKMAAGGIHDQLAGGFHRYSVDERWIVPHFEKMAYDNSELLKNYVHAFQSFAVPEFARVAKGILRWMDEVLSDRERGGFYASQDADDSLEDDGDYFTWTRAEAKAVLTAEEFAVAAPYFNLRDVGDMHHNPQKNVLHLGESVETIASRSNRTPVEVRETLAAAAAKLYAARLQRRTPYVDKTIYTGWNGMCIAAYFAAARVLDLPEVREFALRSLDRVLSAAWNPAEGLAHVVAYGETGGSAARVAGVLEDYGFLANAALDAWESTGELRYFTVAQEIADAMLTRFYDVTGSGFFDTERVEGAPAPIGALSARRKPLQDAPTPAGNSVAATLLLRLAALTNREVYNTRAQETLETFAGVVEHFGLYAASYGLALRRAVESSTQICIAGSDDQARELEIAAIFGFAVNKSVVRVGHDLPPALAETLPNLPSVEGSYAVVCKGNTCLPPVQTVEALREALNS
ncbi:thioredoxin domain-containing protein [Granulicella sp. S156]|uniref:thioredoxin domain-containing protein n=1 Tax=Granulicella sp. S156 TaxID=1747224 RepID=UPI00131A795D|nr:thioredoxin domain-containing protein [Granulicella sp. S156]